MFRSNRGTHSIIDAWTSYKCIICNLPDDMHEQYPCPGTELSANQIRRLRYKDDKTNKTITEDEINNLDAFAKGQFK